MCIDNTFSSFAAAGYLSRILIFSHPGSQKPGSQISDLTTATKKRRKKLVVLRVFVAINSTKVKIILFLNRYRKIFEPGCLSRIPEPRILDPTTETIKMRKNLVALRVIVGINLKLFYS
jgi:hypothetical protein